MGDENARDVEFDGVSLKKGLTLTGCMKMRITSLLTASALVLAAWSAGASANSTTITQNAKPPGTFTVECGDGCQGFYDPDYKRQGFKPNTYVFGETFAFSPDFSTAWAGVTPGDVNGVPGEAAFLDRMLLALEEDPASSIFSRKFDVKDSTFSTTREYFWIKHGTWTAYFRNPNPGTAITVSFFKQGVPEIFSHYGVAGVPIPPAFLLFGSALIGVGWLARRQRGRRDPAGMTQGA